MVFNILTTGIDRQDAPNFTTFNASKKGSSLLFDTLSAMGYNVKKGYEPLSVSCSIFDVYIFIQPDYISYDNSSLEAAMNWVYHGGRLIYLDTDSITLADDYAVSEGLTPSASNDYYYLYYYGLGELITGDADLVLNQNLMNDPEAGSFLGEIISSWTYDNIVFNEYIHGYSYGQSSWSRTPGELKILVYQIAIALALLVWHLGKRFGNPIPYYEESEREENEYVKALANLYRISKSYQVVIETLRREFISTCGRFFHLPVSRVEADISTIWKASGLPHADKLEFILKTEAEPDKKVFTRFIKSLKSCESALQLKGDTHGHNAVYYTAR